MRSTIEKYLIVYGYEPSIGIFHKSTLNNFNLADDIIEAYRPLVDLFVRYNALDDEELSTSRKAQLVNLLNADTIIDGKLLPVQKRLIIPFKVLQALSRAREMICFCRR